MNDVSIIAYSPDYQPDFKRLNIDWISRYFTVEQHDLEQLDQPETYILPNNGQIFFARLGDEIVGCVAMINTGMPDHGMPDHGMPDHGMPDHGMPDHGMPDHGMPDHGMPDHGMPDHGMPDHGMPDHGMPDHGMPDHSSPDHGETSFELAKMAVSPGTQGKGIGKKLCLAAVDYARQLGVKTIWLESNRVLTPALTMYASVGFREVPSVPTPYSRADIRMEMVL